MFSPRIPHVQQFVFHQPVGPLPVQWQGAIERYLRWTTGSSLAKRNWCSLAPRWASACSAPISWLWRMEEYLSLISDHCRWFSVDHVGENDKFSKTNHGGLSKTHPCLLCLFLPGDILGCKVLNLIRWRYWRKIFKFKHCRKLHNWIGWANNMPPLAGCWQLGLVGSQGWWKCSGQSTDPGSLSDNMLDTEVTPNLDSWYLPLLQNCSKWGPPNITNRNSLCYGLEWILMHQGYFVTYPFCSTAQVSNI